MPDDRAKEWTLRALAAETGVPVRTIRFYISRGLVDPPLRPGRAAAYGMSHRASLGRIRAMQAKGMMLAEIAHALAASAAAEPGAPAGPKAAGVAGPGAMRIEREPEPRDMLWFESDGSLDGSQRALMEPPAAEEVAASFLFPEPETWRSYTVAADVRIWVRTGASPWRAKALLAALRRFAHEVGRIVPKEKR